MYKSIIAVFSLAAAVSAAPSALEKRKTNTEAQQQCGNNLTLKCCESVTTQVLNLIPINVGIQCVDISVLTVVDVTQQCKQTVACCQSGSQTGLVNVGNVCPVIL